MTKLVLQQADTGTKKTIGYEEIQTDAKKK